MAKLGIRKENEWQDPQGQVFQLCVFCELDETREFSTASVMIVDGMSVCRYHAMQLMSERADPPPTTPN